MQKLMLLLIAMLMHLGVNLGGQAEDLFILGKGTNVAHWLSQSDKRGIERKNFMTEADFSKMKALGFDHVRLPIDEEHMWFQDGRKDTDAFKILHDAIGWSLAHDLKIVIDLHVLRAHHFNEQKKNSLWTDPKKQAHFMNLWQQLSAELQHYPTDMVTYELLNEPVAENHEDWNSLVARTFSMLRALEKDRWIVIGSNMWQAAHTFNTLRCQTIARLS